MHRTQNLRMQYS